MRRLALLFAFLATPLSAHELWLEPLAYQVPAEERLRAHIVNGEEFEGSKLPYLPQRFVNFLVFSGDQRDFVEGRAGDMPAMDRPGLGEGLHVVGYQSTPATIGYAEWAKFQKFADHKDFPDIRARHDARGLPEAGFDEVYSRFSKSLVGVGHAEGADMRLGLETELVALDNPYTDDLSGGLHVQLFYQRDVRADAQVELFQKAPDGTVTITLHRTDAEGVATLPVLPGHAYMADAVMLREPSPGLAETTGAVWETLWANLTFAVPQ